MKRRLLPQLGERAIAATIIDGDDFKRCTVFPPCRLRRYRPARGYHPRAPNYLPACPRSVWAARWGDIQLIAPPAAIGLIDNAHRAPSRRVVAAISFILYAGTLFALPQMRDIPLCCELSSLAAAVSNVVYKGTIALLVPRDYLTQGRFGTVVWHRVFTSLGWNPAYPFPGVSEMFDCKRYVPEGIGPGVTDRNGHCIWWDYTIRHNISETDTVNGTYGGRYETAAREAFFKIARRYPGEVLVTFLYYKPPLILDSLRESIKMDLNAYPSFAIGLLVAALANLLLYFCSLAGQPTGNIRWVVGLTLLCAAFSIPQLLVAWANPTTAADLFFFCVFGAGLALGTAVATGTRLALRAIRA